jgi:hypothetical protein
MYIVICVRVPNLVELSCPVHYCICINYGYKWLEIIQDGNYTEGRRRINAVSKRINAVRSLLDQTAYIILT